MELIVIIRRTVPRDYFHRAKSFSPLSPMAFLSWQYASAESIKRNMEILKNLQVNGLFEIAKPSSKLRRFVLLTRKIPFFPQTYVMMSRIVM